MGLLSPPSIEFQTYSPAPRDAPALPATGSTKTLSNPNSLSTAAFITLLRATPPARHTFSWRVRSRCRPTISHITEVIRDCKLAAMFRCLELNSPSLAPGVIPVSLKKRSDMHGDPVARSVKNELSILGNPWRSIQNICLNSMWNSSWPVEASHIVLFSWYLPKPSALLTAVYTIPNESGYLPSAWTDSRFP